MRRAADRRRNAASETGTKRGRVDNHERYCVEYKDGMGTRSVFGFTNDIAEAQAWGATILAHPVWRFPAILDRKTKTRVKVNGT